MFVVGDVAGQFDTLIKLIEPFKSSHDIVLAGDIVDRGPKSRQVVQLLLDNPAWFKAVMGNHEDMMIDWYWSKTDEKHIPVYDSSVWLENGGWATLLSYGNNRTEQIYNMGKHIATLQYLPIEHSKGNVFVSHAPWNARLSTDRDLVWHRGNPKEMPDKLQIFGHNSMWGLLEFKNSNNKVFAVCMDTSASQKLSGILVNEETLEYQIYSEDYV